jgi:hypothetical protein
VDSKAPATASSAQKSIDATLPLLLQPGNYQPVLRTNPESATLPLLLQPGNYQPVLRTNPESATC